MQKTSILIKKTLETEKIVKKDKKKEKRKERKIIKQNEKKKWMSVECYEIVNTQKTKGN